MKIAIIVWVTSLKSIYRFIIARNIGIYCTHGMTAYVKDSGQFRFLEILAMTSACQWIKSLLLGWGR